MTKKGYLILEDGFWVEGNWLGDETITAGEVVFNTSHSGYQEILTDPSYFQQIMVFTAPQIGNYGCSDFHAQSERVWVQGVVALEVFENTSDNLKDYLVTQGVPLLSEVMTRKLVFHLREKGVVWGAMGPAENVEQAKKNLLPRIKEKKSAVGLDWPFEVTTKKVLRLSGTVQNGPRMGVIDFGVKRGILEEIRTRSQEVIVFPCRTEAKAILEAGLDGLVLSNGPGDPAEVKGAPDVVTYLIGKLPIMAICMGHQVLSLALGGRTYKLKFGHRGGNHPIRDEVQRLVYVAAHNHGYAVARESLPTQIPLWLTNLNDNSLAGFAWPEKRILSVQFHPEASPGPWEARRLFDWFFKSYLMQG